MFATGGCGGDAHMAHSIHHPGGMLIIATAVAELPLGALAKGVQCAFLGHDEAVRTAGRRAACFDARQRFYAPRQQQLIEGAPVAALPE